MRKLLDKLTCVLAVAVVLASGVGSYAFLNVITRPEMITVAVELPQRKGIVKMWDLIDPTDNFDEPPEWYTDHEANQQDYYDPLTFVNTRAYTAEEHVCMAKNIYFEARQESIKGQLLVALVTLQRVEDPRWPSNVCDVVYEHKQFSWYWDGLSDFPKNTKSFNQVALVASAIMSDDTSLRDFTHNATHYHADYVSPTWSTQMIKIIQVDTHIAYRDEPELRTSL